MAGYIGSRAAVAISNAYTKAEADALYATTTQGALADTAVQPNDSPTFGTVTATSFVGDGSTLTGVGGSTTAGAVGTYVIAVQRIDTDTDYNVGDAIAGSSLFSAGTYIDIVGTATTAGNAGGTSVSEAWSATSFSGTWQAMGYSRNTAAQDEKGKTLWVRIS